MLVFDQKLMGLPVASVQASHRIAEVTGYIIDPTKLHLVALYVQPRNRHENLILHTSDIRDFSLRGLLVDHDEQLMESDGLVRLQQTMELNFVLLGKPVVTEDGAKLGKIGAFVFDTTTWLIMKLHLGQNPVRNLNTNEIIISRQQIVKITDTEITVKSTGIKAKPAFSLRRMLFGNPKPALNPETNPSSNQISE